jgi:hypothetical protein
MGQSEINAQLTLMELAKRTHNSNIQRISEVLSTKNIILKDAVWAPANGPTSHTFTKRLSEPSGTWRQLNYGVQPEASMTQQIVEGIGMLEAYSKVDKVLVELAENPAEFRFTEDLAFLAGLGKTFATALMYANKSTNPEQFDGFTTRYNAASDANVWDNGDTGSVSSSIWLVKWSTTEGAHLVYPKSHNAFGIDHEDLGKQLVEDSAGGLYEAYVSHFKVHAGLCVKDDRSVQRIASIDSSITVGSGAGFLDIDYVVKALNQMLDDDCVMYVNRAVKTILDIYAIDKSNGFYTQMPDGNIWGRPVTYFQGIPIRLVEALVNTEDAV